MTCLLQYIIYSHISEMPLNLTSIQNLSDFIRLFRFLNIFRSALSFKKTIKKEIGLTGFSKLLVAAF